MIITIEKITGIQRKYWPLNPSWKREISILIFVLMTDELLAL